MYRIITFYCSEMLDSHLPENLRISVAGILTTLTPGSLRDKTVRQEECKSCTHLIGTEGEDAIQIFY